MDNKDHQHISEELGRLSEAVEGVRDSVDFLRRAIVGNGKDGLLVRVSGLEQSRTSGRWVWRTFLAAFIASVLTLVARYGIMKLVD